MITVRLINSTSPWRWVLLAAGLVIVFLLPWMIYPPVALDIVAWGLFAVALDLLLGFTGMLSFGHAAFWGGSAYATGLIALHTGLPYVVAILGGALFAAVLAVPIGYLGVRRTGIYFAMVTLAFAQLIYYVANQWRSVTGGENGLQGIPRNAFGTDVNDPFYFYYLSVPILLVALWGAWRVVNSRFGRVLVAIRENPARARALGYPVDRYRVTIFVISAFLSGIAGGVYALGHGFASLQEVYWTTSGNVVIMTILGGMGTLWGGLIGAAIVVLLHDYLATAGFDANELVTGLLFIVTVLAFRKGIWGTAERVIATWTKRRETPASPSDDHTSKDSEPVS